MGSFMYQLMKIVLSTQRFLYLMDTEFLKTQFGLCISPIIFQRFINYVSHEEIRMGYFLVYIDDLVIIANTVEENIERLKVVFQKAACHGLIVNWKKCQFRQRQIDYLGYRVECNSLSPSPVKLAAVAKYPRPMSIEGVQSFLG
jgi:hypothetical protein